MFACNMKFLTNVPLIFILLGSNASQRKKEIAFKNPCFRLQKKHVKLLAQTDL